jgi:glycosyltransferase involved in cell wall biosynthesis
LLEGGVDAALVEVIPDGTILDRDVEPVPRSTLGVADDAPLVVMVGALTPEKDPRTFVRAVTCALRKVPALRALLVGDGPMRRELESQVERIGIAHALQLTGYRDDADALIAASDIVVLSSMEEGLGSVLLDAMAFGKPVVATTAGGIPDVVARDESGLLVEPCDAEALGEAIVRLACDRELAARLALGARARAPRFSMREVVARTTAVYERVLGASGSRGAR